MRGAKLHLARLRVAQHSAKLAPTPLSTRGHAVVAQHNRWRIDMSEANKQSLKLAIAVSPLLTVIDFDFIGLLALHVTV